MLLATAPAIAAAVPCAGAAAYETGVVESVGALRAKRRNVWMSEV